MAALNGTSHAGAAIAETHEDVQDDERGRLEAEIVAMTARIEAVGQRKQEREAALRAAVERTKAELAELERQHDRAVTMVRESAAAEVERILSVAQQQLAPHESPQPKPVDVNEELPSSDGQGGPDDVQ